MNQKSAVSPATWFSGFFALGALAHAVRAALDVPLVVNNFAIPVSMSVAIAVIFGMLSIGLLYLVACRHKSGACQ